MDNPAISTATDAATAPRLRDRIRISLAGIQPHPLRRAEMLAGLQQAIAPFLVSRAIVWLGTEFGARLIPWKALTYTSGLVPSAPLVPFFHWDSDYYASIMRYGYAYAPPPAEPSNYRAAFFPLYPLLSRLAGGSDWAMLLIPNLCFALALALMYVLARRHLDDERANLTVWLVSLAPSAMFFSYPYTESLLLLLSVGAFLMIESDMWLVGGVLGFAAATTRFPGVLIAAAFGAEAVIKRRAIIAVAAMMAVLGLGVVSYVDRLQMGDWLGFYHAQSLWIGPPRNVLHIIGSFPKAILDGDPFRTEAYGLPILIVFAIAAVWVAMRMPAAYGAFAVTQVLLAARQGWTLHFLNSVPRYLVIVFPCFFAFATLLAGRRNLQLVWLLGSASLMLVFSALFGAWQFIG